MTVTPRASAASMVRAELTDLSARVRAMELSATLINDLEQAVERIAARCELLVEVSDGIYGELVERLDRLGEELDELRGAIATTPPAADREPTAGALSSTYAETVRRVRTLVMQLTPPGAIVAIAGKGDPALIDLDERIGWHFPRQADGRYLGFYPRNDAEAVAMLDDVRLAGATFLVFPSTSLWWLEFYRGLGEHLREHHVTVVRDAMTCAIFRLVDPSAAAAEDP